MSTDQEQPNASSRDAEDILDDETRQWPPVFRDEKVHVVKDKCSTCVFLPGNVMHLNPGQLKEMVDGSVADGVPFACHQTLSYGTYTDHYEGEAVCGGLVEKHGDKFMSVRLAKAMSVVEEVEPAPPRKRPGAQD